MEQFLFLFEIIGTVAFAVSGAIAAIHSAMDLFGVLMLGIITATAGGAGFYSPGVCRYGGLDFACRIYCFCPHE